MNIKYYLLIAIGVVLVIGIGKLISEMRNFYRLRNSINEFSGNLIKLIKKVDSDKNCDTEVNYFFQKHVFIKTIVYNNRCYDPISEFERMFKNRTYVSQRAQSLYSEFVFDAVTAISTLDAKRLQIRNRQMINPFVWLYKGIEVILWIIFGYLIKSINPDFSSENRIWKIIVGTLSAAATVMTIMCFFGLDYKTIRSCI